MDIIKHGKNFIQKYKATCCYCDCEFTYSENDRHGYDILFPKQYVTCPECHKWLAHRFSKSLSCQK